MNSIYLISIIIGLALQNVAKKAYNEKAGGKGVYFFTALSSVAALLFFVFSPGGFQWNAAVIGYAIAFAFVYAVTSVSAVIAFECGSLSLTTLICSYSLMIPTVYGLIILHDPVGKGLFPGLALLVVSLVLTNKKSASVPITPKWIVSVSISFLAGGMCTVVQKMQQVAFDGAYKNEFMIMSLLIVVVTIGIISAKYEGKETAVYAKKGWLLATACGVMNGMVNLFVMILSGKMPASVMFPLVSAGGIVVTYILAKVIYKEKLSFTQQIGYVLGVLAVVLLNI